MSRNKTAAFSEKLRVGFVPLVDCGPLVMAKETGLFADAGLNVELMREPGWATIRDKIVYRELDAAHALVGLTFAVSLGLGVLVQPCVTGFLFNSHGDAITISQKLYESGVTDAATLKLEIDKTPRDHPIRFGVPHLFSSHHFILRQWLQPAGIKPDSDVQIIVLPPSLMVSCLESGTIDGFCVGEPFNTIAFEEGSGTILDESARISPMHPEKALMVTREFSETKHELHIELIRCLVRASKLCDSPEGREELATILARPEYLDMDRKHIRRSLFKEAGSMDSDDFHLFNRFGVNEPTMDKGNWIAANIKQAGLFTDSHAGKKIDVESIFRPDIYRDALGDSEANAMCPSFEHRADSKFIYA